MNAGVPGRSVPEPDHLAAVPDEPLPGPEGTGGVPAVWIAGVRSFALELLGYAADAGIEIAGLLDPGGVHSAPTDADGRVHGHRAIALETTPAGAVVLLGTGDPDRHVLVERLRGAGARLATLVHPTAHLAPGVRLGDGVIVGPRVVVGAATTIGDAAALGRGALVGHHTQIEELVTIGPGANVAGNATIGAGAHVAMAASVRDHVTIGVGAAIAMGSVVVADVAPGAVVRGVPAR